MSVCPELLLMAPKVFEANYQAAAILPKVNAALYEAACSIQEIAELV
jgi:hypothetical protein